MKKWIAFLLALTMLLSLAACGGNNTADNNGGAAGENTSDQTEGAGQEEQKGPVETEFLNAAAELSGVDPEAVIVTVDGNEVTAGIYFYQLLYTASRLLEAYGGYFTDPVTGDLLWDSTMPDGQLLMDFLTEAAKTNTLAIALIENVAEEHGVEFTEANREELDSYVTLSEEEAGGREAYEKELNLLGLTWEDNYRMAQNDYYFGGLMEKTVTEGDPLYITDEVLYSYPGITEDKIMADHILLEPGEDEESRAKYRELMEQMLTLLADAPDPVDVFAYLGDSYSQDPGRASCPDGYVFGKGEMVAPFEEAAFALEEYEISDIVESEFGFHIIMRKPLRDYVKRDYLVEKIGEYQNTAAVEWNEELLAQIDISEIYGLHGPWYDEQTAAAAEEKTE